MNPSHNVESDAQDLVEGLAQALARVGIPRDSLVEWRDPAAVAVPEGDLCNACMFGECEHCWSESSDPWPDWAGEPYDCTCSHRVTPPGGSGE